MLDSLAGALLRPSSHMQRSPYHEHTGASHEWPVRGEVQASSTFIVRDTLSVLCRAQGQKSKTFRYAPLGQEGQDLYLSVEMNEPGKPQQKYGLPVTRGEHEVVTRIAKV